MHRIPAGNVLYIDVGKKTTALLQTPSTAVAPSTCFLLLTQAGSLDLHKPIPSWTAMPSFRPCRIYWIKFIGAPIGENYTTNRRRLSMGGHRPASPLLRLGRPKTARLVVVFVSTIRLPWEPFPMLGVTCSHPDPMKLKTI